MNPDEITTMTSRQAHDNDDIPNEIDFSGGERGKFYHKDAQLRLPIHLEASVQKTLTDLANAKGVDLSVLVNDLLKKDIELLQMGH